ncbi:hypothetical protein [Streptosporangium sp. NPDC003464]
MTQDITVDLGWAPSACTLPTAEQPLRVAEFDALFADAVQGVARPERTRLRLELVFSPDNAARTAELTARENGCCVAVGWMRSAGRSATVRPTGAAGADTGPLVSRFSAYTATELVTVGPVSAAAGFTP